MPRVFKAAVSARVFMTGHWARIAVQDRKRAVFRVGIPCVARRSMRNRVLTCAILACVVAVAGCKINPRESEYVPKVTGNTFDLQNDLAVTLPEAERINVSYLYVQTHRREDYVGAEGYYEGPMWWYQERTLDIPQEYIGIHLLRADPDEPENTGNRLKMSKTSYLVQSYCFDLSKDEVPPDIAPYVESFLDLGQPVSTDIYLRRFILQEPRELEFEPETERTDLVYIRDIVRLGYTCDMIGDVVEPSPDFQDIINQLNIDAESAFEVMS
jgi:hypothetical protein